MGGAQQSLLLPSSLVRALRIAFGVALFAAVFMVLTSSGAFAASGAGTSSGSSESPGSRAAAVTGKGLLSGILNPIANVVDKTLPQVPVVGDIVAKDTVGTVIAPVATVTGQVEGSVASVPAVGAVVVPVHELTNSVVPPVIHHVDAAATQITGVVEQVAAPAINPVTEAVEPVVDVAVDVVSLVMERLPLPVVPDNAAMPILPGMPAAPVVPDIPVVPVVPIAPVLPVVSVMPENPGVTIPPVMRGIPGGNSGVEDLANDSGQSSQPADANHRQGADHDALATTVVVEHVNSLADYLPVRAVPGALAAAGVSSQIGAVSPDGLTGFAACSSELGISSVGPCAPAVASSPSSGPSSSPNAGGAGGVLGSAAANENFSGHFNVAGGIAALPDADRTLPDSMPANPGTTPG